MIVKVTRYISGIEVDVKRFLLDPMSDSEQRFPCFNNEFCLEVIRDRSVIPDTKSWEQLSKPTLIRTLFTVNKDVQALHAVNKFITEELYNLNPLHPMFSTMKLDECVLIRANVADRQDKDFFGLAPWKRRVYGVLLGVAKFVIDRAERAVKKRPCRGIRIADDEYSGCRGKKNCSVCHGSGFEPYVRTATCPGCKGTGRIVDNEENGSDPDNRCLICEGRGRVPENMMELKKE
jgi:hypothetical protein